MTPDERLRPPSHERLAVPVQHVDLAAVTARLRSEAHASVGGHRQVALVRRGPLTVILFAFEPDGFLKEHSADGEVTIHVLAGRLEVTVDGELRLPYDDDLNLDKATVVVALTEPHASCDLSVQVMEDGTWICAVLPA